MKFSAAQHRAMKFSAAQHSADSDATSHNSIPIYQTARRHV